MGTIKGVGRIYQQTFVDTYTKMAFVKLYDRKNALVAADLLNDQVLSFFEEENVRLLRILTDRGTEYCGALEHHEYELYLAVEDIDHTKTKALSPQTNGICERFHRTIWKSFTRWLFGRRSITRLRSFRWIWTSGYGSITMSVLILENTASAAPFSRLFKRRSTWPRRRCWIPCSPRRGMKLLMG